MIFKGGGLDRMTCYDLLEKTYDLSKMSVEQLVNLKEELKEELKERIKYNDSINGQIRLFISKINYILEVKKGLQ